MSRVSVWAGVRSWVSFGSHVEGTAFGLQDIWGIDLRFVAWCDRFVAKLCRSGDVFLIEPETYSRSPKVGNPIASIPKSNV